MGAEGGGGFTECRSWPPGYKTFFLLNLTEHKISTAHKNYRKYQQIKKFIALSLSDVIFIKLAIVGILTFMSGINFVLS